ncbi:hypothetical protein [Jatrophihabitans sp.]|uniref:hypothetical protein n=1 Tax=Jatrophihabitans sp. TaxID=1932789 RepID=UPI002C877DB4|nr:hypothetical protein [Jatrophihabitans sp.]
MADISRRTLLNRALLGTALGGGALLGLTRRVHHQVATPPPPPPVALTAALARQRQLLASYDRVLVGERSHPGLAGLRADVAAHGTALHEVLQRYPGWRLAVTASTSRAVPAPGSSSSGPSSTAAADPIAALAEASRTAATATTAACLQWPDTEPHAAEVVPLLGSIAACLTSHVQVLR